MAGRPKGVPNVQLKVPVITRIRQLHDAHLSHAAIAAVVELDHGIKLTVHQVRYYVGRQGWTGRRGIVGMSHRNEPSAENLKP